MPGLIGLDLDGTVLNDEKKITFGVKSAISYAIEQGFHVLPITGRPMIGLPEDLMAIPGMDYAITANGAEIYRINDYSKRDYEKIYGVNLSSEAIYHTLAVSDEYDLIPDVFINGQGHMDYKNYSRIPTFGFSPAITDYILKTKSYDKIFAEVIRENINNISKITVNFPDVPDRAELKKKCSVIFSKVPDVSVVSGAIQNLEITNIEAKKGNGLLMLADILNIPHNMTMAIGDDGNDFDMVSKAYWGVSMGNGVDELKKIADYVTGDNNHDGVAEAIYKFINR